MYSSDLLAAANVAKDNPCLVTRQFSSRLQKSVFSNSVLCMGGINSNPVKAWKEKIDWFMNSRQYRELDLIDEELVELEWNIFPGFTTTLGILAEIQKDNVIFMSLKKRH